MRDAENARLANARHEMQTRTLSVLLKMQDFAANVLIIMLNAMKCFAFGTFMTKFFCYSSCAIWCALYFRIFLSCG